VHLSCLCRLLKTLGLPSITAGHNARMAPTLASSPATAASAATPKSPSDQVAKETDLLRIARSQVPASSSSQDVMQSYRAYRDTVRQSVLTTYNILGFLSSGTYGRVYKASLKGHHKSWAPEDERSGVVFAIKKFKPDKEEHATYTGISQSAMREIALDRELQHENIITLREVTLEDKSIYMIFHYASHDLLQVIHHHSTVLRTPIALPVLKSLLFQLLNGIHYLHSHFVLHRDLKPANILLTREGVVKIADLGLARIYQAPLQSLYAGDKVVVTIWYRAPELLLGARHYNYKIDMWAVGCIWGELLALRPMFKGEEAKMDAKNKTTLFQT
jgi:cyclin-dependent kinase 8/11